MSGFLVLGGHVWSWVPAVANANTVNSVGQSDFWYDASMGQYFTPASLASGGTTTGWYSKNSGSYVPTTGFGPTYGGGSYSLPNLYFAGTNAQNPVVASFTATIAVSTAKTFTGTVTQTVGNAATATLNVTSNTAATIGIGYLVTGGTLPTGTYIYANQSGTATSSASSWTITVPQGTTIPTNASSVTYTVTPVIMTVSTTGTGIVNLGGIVYKSSGGPSANTFVTATANENSSLTGTGGTGTYLVNISQTLASTTALTQFLPFVGFNSGDAFRVPMTAGDRVVSGYTVCMSYKWGVATGHVSMLGSTHGNGGDFSWGNNAGVREYNVAGATATGGSVSATGWHVISLVYDGTQPDNASRFKVFVDGVQDTLTFTGTVGSSTTAPAAMTCTASAAAISGSNMVLTYPTTGSPAWQVGDTITVSGLVPAQTSGTVNNVNGTFTVTTCTNTTVGYAMSGTYTRTSGGTVTGTPIPNLMVAGKAPIASATKNTNPVTTTQGINIGEFIVYKTALTPAARSSVETYLRNKWLGKA